MILIQSPTALRALLVRVRTVAVGFCVLNLISLAAPAQVAPVPAAQSTVTSIVRDPRDLPLPVNDRPLATLPPNNVVRVLLTATEVTAPVDPDNGVYYKYWTFNGKVPGPMIRVRVGDTVVVTLRNNPDDKMAHSIDLHAALGQGGGAALTQVPPGEERTFSFVAITPGLFVYHCGTPMVAEHVANGMYGLILVEPAEGLKPVDHEYYVMQGEIYAPPPPYNAGVPVGLDQARLMAATPQYYVMNGAVGALSKQYPMTASVGQSVRIFFGNAGPNATSSPHMIGEIFQRVFAFGSLLSPPLLGVQTATVPPGGAAIFELKAHTPGKFPFMDHALVRMEQGLMAILSVSGTDSAHLMQAGAVHQLGAIPPLAITAQDSADALLAAASHAPAPMIQVEPVSNVVAGGTRVTMSDKAFMPAAIQITAGQSITWQNTSGVLHTVVDDPAQATNPADVSLPVGAATFNSPYLPSGQSYTRTFNQPGIYHYVCTQHESSHMVGTIIVRPAGSKAAASLKHEH